MKFLKHGGKSTYFFSMWKESVPADLTPLKSGMVSQNTLPGEIVLTEEMGREIAHSGSMELPHTQSRYALSRKLITKESITKF